MSSSNKTANYGLSQFAPGDKPMWINDINTDLSKIDSGLIWARDKAVGAANSAASAASAASTAQSAANTAQTAANAAHTEAMTAQTTATKAQGSANNAGLKVQAVAFSGAPENSNLIIHGIVVTNDNNTGLMAVSVNWHNNGTFGVTSWGATTLSTITSPWKCSAECYNNLPSNLESYAMLHMGPNSKNVEIRWTHTLTIPGGSWHIGELLVPVRHD